MKPSGIICLMCLFVLPSIAQETKKDTLPQPFETKSVMNFSNVIGWKENQKPVAPDGFIVTRFSAGLENPRWMCVTPNGDVLVAESNSNHSLAKKIGGTLVGASQSNSLKQSADRITLLRDADNDGYAEFRDTLLKDLNQPFGMLILGNWLYVANTDALWRFPYKEGMTTIKEPGEKLTDLPAGEHNQHWTRNIIANKDGTKIYIAVGSGSNLADHGIDAEHHKACILEINPDGSGKKLYAAGLRNPVGMDWAPGTSTLWTVVNERDGLGDDLVPDYLTSVTPGAHYGWPYMYFGTYKDPRVKDIMPDSVTPRAPDFPLISHTASLGLKFYTGKAFPQKYRNGAFIAQHGSWNRSVLSGYKVIFIPFSKGMPAGPSEDFLTGFIADLDKGEVHGRPTGLALTNDGALLLTDDVSNSVWKISYDKK